MPVRFHVRGSLGRVEAWSEFRLQFEMSKTKLFRDAIRVAVKELVPDPGAVLHGVYQSAGTELVDAENVLYYNVTPGHFAPVADQGIRFERAFAAPPPLPGQHDWTPHHFHDYMIVRDGGDFRHWHRGRTLARWEAADCGVLGPLPAPKIAAVWQGVRRATTKIDRSSSPTHYFGLSMTVEHPIGHPNFRLVDAMKALIDGTVAAFHCHVPTTASQDTPLYECVAADLGSTSRKVEAMVLDHSYAVLGSRRLIWKHGKRVQWNPGDDSCVAAEIRRAPRSGLSTSIVNGELFEVVPKRPSFEQGGGERVSAAGRRGATAPPAPSQS